MSLFDGTQSFTPAFTGQELAIRAGGGAAQAWTSGMNAGTSKQGQQLQGSEFMFKQKMYNDQMKSLDELTRARKAALSGGNGDWANESGSPASFW